MSRRLDRILELLEQVAGRLEGQRCANPADGHTCPVCTAVNENLEDVHTVMGLAAEIIEVRTR